SVRDTDGNGCSATSAATTVTVNPIPPTPTVTPGGPTTFCSGGSVTLTSSSASGNQWYLNGAPIGGQTSQTYVASAAGDYTVVVTATGCSSAASAATTVTVNPNPNATITAPSAVSSGSPGNIASVASAGAGATYNWSITNGTITGGTGANSVAFTAGATGTLTLQVTVTTGAGCADTKSANVNVGLPAVTVTSVAPATGSINGQTAVSVNGTGFLSGATVTFGGTGATSVVVVSATKITAVTPAHSAGSVNVTVTNTNTSAGTLTNGYTYAQLFDANGDHTIDPSDIFYLISYLFLHGPAPVGGMTAGDANGDGVVDPADIFYLVNYLFLHGPAPYSEPVVHTSSVSAPLKGSISLGQPVLRGDRYVIPVTVSGAPSAMSLRLGFDAAGEGVTIQRAPGLQPAFEISRHGDRELTYLVAYDGTMDGVVANIEVPAGARLSSIRIEGDGTLLCDREGIRKATVAAGTLTVNGTTVDGGRPHIELPRSER
ncbi:MAG TPA: IPT/TIG domain-containing protein, partial [Thermoanaerobaculia bacterium]